MKKTLALLLALSLTLPMLASCANDQQEEVKTEAATPTAEEVPVEEEVEIDPFEGFDYDGRTFSIHTSANAATVSMISSNYYIQGYEEFTGDLAPDAAIQRNQDVMDRLNIELAYEQTDYTYDVVASNIRQLLQSGDATYQLIINDIYGLAPITPEGLFHNAFDGKNFDFSRGWWYEDFMSDISMNSNSRFMLAGDYFIDQLRCTHCMIMNKDMYKDLYGEPQEVYDMVLEKQWTLDTYKMLLDGAYIDANGNGRKDKDDVFGAIAFQKWGPMIPWLISSDPGFIERDADGYPVLALDNERSYKLTEKLNEIYQHNACLIEVVTDEQQIINMFTSGQSLFVWYQRLGSLESASYRETEVDLAVLPYPMLDELQEDYVTSTHDTAELGFIPVAVAYEDMDFVSAVIEVLCRETNKQVLPQYYESSLKIKYTRDDASAQMIDIIHDHYGNGFALAWSNGLSGVFMSNTFNQCISNGNTDFASKYKSVGKAAGKLLEKFIEKDVEMQLNRQ